MSHPCVVTLDQRSRPRVLFSGDRLVEVALPVGTRCVYPPRARHPSPFDVLGRNEDELSAGQRAQLRLLLRTTQVLPNAARRPLVAGALHELCRTAREHAVPLSGPADVAVIGIPSFSEQYPSTFLNPLLVLDEARRALDGGSLLKKNGTLIVLNPLSDRFDQRQHLPHRAFIHELLLKKKDPLEPACEQAFTQDPALLGMHAHGRGCHPSHPFLVWKQALALRHHLGRLLVVGADNETIPAVLGFETASSMEEALYKSRSDQAGELEIVCLHGPPWPLLDLRAGQSVPHAGAA